MKPSTIAVIRDTNSGASYLVPAESHEAFDLERLDEMGWELSGWLQHPQQFANVSWSEESDTEEADDAGMGYDYKPIYFGPMFTECDRSDCKKQIVISEEGGAPEFCTDHTSDNEAQAAEYYLITKHGEDDYALWITDDMNNEASGSSVRGSLADIKAEIGPLLK